VEGEGRLLSIDGRRSRIQLAAEILRLLRLGEVGKTEVMYTVKLSHLQTQKYLQWLTKLGLIEQPTINRRPPGYRITQHGLDLLGKIEHLQEILHLEGLSEIIDSPELKVEEGNRRGILQRIVNAIRPIQGGDVD
jgi:predicted transcriptional regulator